MNQLPRLARRPPRVVSGIGSSPLLAAIVLVATLVSAALPAHAGVETARARLEAFFQQVSSLQADFHQRIYDNQHRPINEASGTMYLERPDRFRWDYQKPYPQLIVGDGKRVWIYDKDLSQVTVRPMAKTLSGTPAELLSSSHQPLEKSFDIQDLGRKDGLLWVDLRPKAKEASFTDVRIGFDGDVPRQMVLADNFGQTTDIVFSQVVRNPHLDASLFTFTPPQGVDVIGNTENR